MTRQDRMFAKRLLKLARFLRKLPPERFNFTQWAGREWGGKPDLSCGTTACALGWATTIPLFRRAGLCLFKSGFDSRPWVGLVDYQDAKDSPHKAAAKIFDLNNTEFSFLFLPYTEIQYLAEDQLEKFGRTSLPRNASAKQVAEQISFFVKHKYGNISLNKVQ